MQDDTFLYLFLIIFDQKNSTIAKRPNTLSGCHVVKPVLTKGNRKHRRLPAVPAAQVHTSGRLCPFSL